MKLDKIRRLAAGILKVGYTKIWLDPSAADRIKECMTKDDVRAAIKEGLIKKKSLPHASRGRARIIHEKKKKGRKRGRGKRSGTKKTRTKKKEAWMKNVRAQRKKLKEMKEKKVKTKANYGKVYRMIKGGYFKGKKYVEGYVKGVK